MSRHGQIVLLFIAICAMSHLSACGKWFNCLSGKNCEAQKEIENAATADLFLQVVNLSLSSFQGVMTELGLSETQQDDVAVDLQAKAQQLTAKLSLADDSSYTGTMFEKLSAMFQDLMDHVINKIMSVAPNLEMSKIVNACALFMSDMIANAGLVSILESLPVDEQVNIPVDAPSGKLDWEILRAPMERVTTAEFSGKMESAEVGAAFEKFKRRPGDPAPPPAAVISYRPSPTEKASAGSRIENLCDGHPADLGRGRGRDVASVSADRLPLPHKGCEGVSMDKKMVFCLFARPETMNICPEMTYGDGASLARFSRIKIWIDETEAEFSDFNLGKKYDCKVASDRDALMKMLNEWIQTKKSSCNLKAAAAKGPSR